MRLKEVDQVISVTLGPAVDDSDFKSRETVAYNATGIDCYLFQETINGVTATQITPSNTDDNDHNYWTHEAGGIHSLRITAAQNDTSGILWAEAWADGVLTFESPRYGVVPEKVYDALTAGTGTGLKADVAAILATALTEGAGGQLAAAFTKLFDVATPLLVASDAMRGTENAAPSATALSTAQWTNALATALNTLAGHDPGSQLASSAEVTSITNNTRCVRSVPSVIERPDSGSTTYRIELLLYDNVGNMEAPDSAPTIALVNQGGTDRSGRLDNATMSLVSTGRYRAVYTASDSDDLEQLNWTFSVVEGGNTRLYGNTSLVVDTTAVDFTAADRTKLDNVDTIAGNLPNSGSLNDLATILTAIQHGTYGLSALQVLIAALNNLSGAEAQSAAEAALAAYGGAKTTDVSGAHVTTDGKIDGLSIPTAAAIRAEIDANGEFVGEVLGAIAGRQDRNDDGTEIQFYTKGGVLLATRSYSAANKRWTTTWA